jgi:hypothetical protein
LPLPNWKCASTCAKAARNKSLPLCPSTPREDCGTRTTPLLKHGRRGVSKPAGGSTRIGGVTCHSAAMNALSSRSTSVKAMLSAPCSIACSACVSSSAKNLKRRSGSFSAARIPPSAQVSNERRSRLSSTRAERSSSRPTDSGAVSAMRRTTRSHSPKACGVASRRAAWGAATNSASVALPPAISAKSGPKRPAPRRLAARGGGDRGELRRKAMAAFGPMRAAMSRQAATQSPSSAGGMLARAWRHTSSSVPAISG